MFTQHPVAKVLAQMGAFGASPAKVLDSVSKREALLDEAALASATFSASEIRSAAAAAVTEWAETTPADLDDGETLADRLTAFMVGVADENQDGEITDDEATVIDIALNAAYDFLVGKGASEDDVSALLNDGDNDAAGRVQELVKGKLSDGEEGTMSDIDNFTFDTESQQSVMDSVLDAVYKKRMVIRGGKKVRINKRISGHVRLSAAQKVAIRKAGLKSRSASARMHRMKSVKIRARMGL